MAALTKEQIINLALKSAQSTPLASSRQGEFDDIYELKKNGMLNERLWPFTLRLETNFTEKPSNDLNYAFAYQVPPRTINVVQIASNESDLVAPGRGSLAGLSDYTALQLGYSPLSIEDRILESGRNTDFLFTGDTLYAQSPVNFAIVQIQADESAFTEDFTLALAYHLAAHFARSVKGNPALAYELERQAKEHQGRAMRPLLIRPKNLTEIIFQKWLSTYYSERYR